MGIPAALRAPLAMMFLAFMIVIAVFTFGMVRNANGISEGLKKADYESCLRNVQNAEAINTVLDAIIGATSANTLLKADERTTRIKSYQDAMQTRPGCVQP